MPSSQHVVQPHDHVAAAFRAASPAYVRRHETRILTRRGWRSVTHLNNLAQAAISAGTAPLTCFRYLGLV